MRRKSEPFAACYWDTPASMRPARDAQEKAGAVVGLPEDKALQ